MGYAESELQQRYRASGAYERDGVAWAGMLATLIRANRRLEATVNRSFPKTGSRASVAEQVENERGRISRELHAGAGQPLAAIKLHVEMLESVSERIPSQALESLDRIKTLTDAALGQVRAVSHRLHPPAWQGLPLEQALRNLIRDSGMEQKCRTVVAIDPLPFDPPIYVKIAIYRCAQECLSNISRHSGATEIRFELSVRSAWLELTVSDNGKGMPPDAVNRGIGLAAMREHAEAADGVVHVTTKSGGTRITVGVPVPEDFF